MSESRYPVGIVGGGAWGTALASVMAQIHPEVLIWARESDVVTAINETHENSLFLRGLKLASNIRATGDLAAMEACGALLIVTPAQHVRATLSALPQTDAPLLLCAKGIEAGTEMLMSDIAAEVRPESPLAVLSGPTFAHEVAAGKPTAITLATANQALGAVLMRFMVPHKDWQHNPFKPGDLAKVMGPYYPRGYYTTKAQFEAEGAKPPPPAK